MSGRKPNDFTWHKGAVEAKEKGKLGDYLHEYPPIMNQVETGTYRSKNKEGTYSGVIFWHEEGDNGEYILKCEVNGEPPKPYRYKKTGRIVGSDDPERLWTMFSYCIKGPIRYTAYKYFLDNGRWSDENELSAQDRSLDSRNPDLPDPNSFEGLSTRLGIMATEARRIVGLGPASSKPEADRAADLKNTVAMLHKALEVGFEAEKAPINDKLQKCRIKWTPLINDAKDCKDALNIKVITPWLAVERARAEQEALAAKQAQAQAVLDNVPIPTTRRGEAKTELPSAGNFGRKTHTREVWTPEITDRYHFLEYVKDYPAITEALEKIARTFKSTRPEIPGLTYKQTFEAV